MTTERSSEISSPYAAQPAAAAVSTTAPANASKPFDLDAVKKVRTVHLAQAKATGQKFSMLTCSDHYSGRDDSSGRGGFSRCVPRHGGC